MKASENIFAGACVRRDPENADCAVLCDSGDLDALGVACASAVAGGEVEVARFGSAVAAFRCRASGAVCSGAEVCLADGGRVRMAPRTSGECVLIGRALEPAADGGICIVIHQTPEFKTING